MEQISLGFLEEQLQFMTSSWSPEDWSNNKDGLLRIRNLTHEPRNAAPRRPKQKPANDSINTLKELLELSDEGQPSSAQVEQILDVLDSEVALIEFCGSFGLQPKATAVAKAIFRSLERSVTVYKDIWHSLPNFHNSEGTTAFRLLATDESVESEGDVNGARYRINALLFALYYRARCEVLVKSKQRETIVLKAIMEDSGKGIHQIKNLLKRGRWYTRWVTILGPGAILMLGGSLASSNQMHNMDRLIRVCKAMPGFCKRSRTLSRFARKAIIEAIVRSGQPVPVITQRHIDSPRIVDISDDDRLADLRPQTIECQAINQRSLYEVHVASGEGSHARSALAVPNLTDVNQRMQVMDQQRHTDTRFDEQQKQDAREASSMPLPNADDAEQLLPRPVAAVQPASGAQVYFETSLDYGNVDGTVWDGRALSTRYDGELDLNTWNCTFPMPFVL